MKKILITASFMLFAWGAMGQERTETEQFYDGFVAACENMDCSELSVRSRFNLLRWELSQNKSITLKQRKELRQTMFFYYREYKNQ